MDEQRALAFNIAQTIAPEELDQIFGGASDTGGFIIIPTLVVTGAPLIPDTTPDTH